MDARDLGLTQSCTGPHQNQYILLNMIITCSIPQYMWVYAGFPHWNADFLRFPLISNPEY